MSKIRGKYIDYDSSTLGLNVSGQLTALSSGGISVSVIATNTSGVKNTLYVITASLTLTLPSNPSVSDSLKVSNLSGTNTCIIARNGSNIMGLAEDLTIDKQNAGFELVYSGTTKGWVII